MTHYDFLIVILAPSNKYITMENQENNLQITESIKESFFDISKWANFLSILGYIMLCFMLLTTVGLFLSGLSDDAPMVGEGVVRSTSQGSSTTFPINPIVMGIIYLGFTVVYYFPIRYLRGFATQIKNAMLNGFQGDFESAIKSLSSHYKFLGIMTIVSIAVGIIMFFIAISFAAGMKV
jgi:magnesium-transporting ATPase (P-type)